MLCTSASAVEPKLELIVPPGGTCGTQTEIELRGERLGDLRSLVFYQPGLTLESFRVVDERQVRAVVNIAANCRLGQHALRVVTQTGVSEVRSFHVSRFPSSAEQEPNDTPDQAQLLKLNQTIDGVLRESDADRFALELEAGRRFSAEVEAVRLGSMVEVQGSILIDPVLELRDKAGTLVAEADDDGFAGRDPVLSLIVSRSGRYVLTVRDAVGAGSEKNFYRLHFGDFSRSSVVYPAGGIAGRRHSVQFLDDNGGSIEHAFTAPDGGERLLELFAPAPTLAAVPNLFRVSSFPGIFEREPNNTLSDANIVSDVEAFAFNGVIERPGDIDCFRFTPKHSCSLNVRVYAKKLGSPLDTIAALYGARKGNLIVEGNDSDFMDDLDGPSTDSFLRVAVEADKSYVLQIRGHQNSGGPNCVYRAELTPVEPWLAAYVREQSQYSQDRLAIAVPRGNRFLTMIGVRRANIEGPLELHVDGLPHGVRCASARVPTSVDAVPLVFEAAADAPLGAALGTVHVSHADKPEIRGDFRQSITLSVGFPAYTPHCQFTTDKLVIAVVEKAPFRITLIPPKVPLVRQGELRLQVQVDREAGFAGPVEVQLPFKPPGVGAYPSIIIPAGETVGYYPLNAEAGAELGSWPIGVMATGLIGGGKLWIASELVELKTAEPYVDLELHAATVEQGGASQVECAVKHLRSLPGKAMVKLCGLPPGVTAPQRELTGDVAMLAFPITCAADAPLGRFDQLYCEATILADGEPIVHNLSRGGLLRVDPSSPRTAAAESPDMPGLSRLERLRREYARWAGRQP